MSSSLYLRHGKIFKVTDKEELDIHESLPIATYCVGYNSCKDEYYLEKIESFSFSHKLYGNTNRLASRILRTFRDRAGSTGVVLTGEKGSGKTLLAKRISILAAEEETITLVINESYCGESFNQFIQMIQQPTVVIFDEFEKVYDEYDKQKKMLTLLDGVYPSKKLFIMTCNDKSSLNVHLKNRPGRIFYMIDFLGLENSFICEYCRDNLSNKEQIPRICAIAQLFKAFNFDMLKAMVEEMNRYNESPTEVLELLNCRPQYESDIPYTVKIFSKEGKMLKCDNGGTWHGNPLNETIKVSYDKGDYDYKEVKFSANDLVHVDNAKSYIFVNKQRYRVVLTREFSSTLFNFKAMESSMKTNRLSGVVEKDIERMLLEDEDSTKESSCSESSCSDDIS